MNKNYTYDFSNAEIKIKIEEEFYKMAGELITQKQMTSSVVTGPDYKRHVDNFKKYINRGSLKIYETDVDIFIKIYQGVEKEHKVLNSSIENSGSTFIDCDLTCTSDLSVIKKTLLNQIDNNSHIPSWNKAFIFSFGLRRHDPKPIEVYLRPIFGILGASIASCIAKDSIVKVKQRECKWMKPIIIHGTKSRIKEYKCYSYNAGGGPMLTCLLIYK